MKTRVSSRALVSLLLIGTIAIPAFARGRKAAPASTEPGTYKEWGPNIDQIEIMKKFRAADYKQIVVQPFDTESVKLPDKGDNTYEPVRKALASSTEGFVQGLRGNVAQNVTVSEKAPRSADTLVVRAKVLAMNPGSKAARYFAGFGAGAAGTKVEGEIVDARTNQVMARFTQERRSGVGMMGGDYGELMQRNLKAIGEDVAHILKEF
ncbi:MAG: hypothetical protein NVSMB68_06500 [Thermoanaerobaculia bacterium]